MKKSILFSFLWMLPLACIAQTPQTLRMAFAGDAIITRKLSVYQEPAFLKMIELIRGADAAFVNLEMLFHDYESYPMHQSGGTYMRGDPALAQELVWAGFDMVSLANNHTGDYGVGGLRSTIHHVEEAGLLHAGAGESLSEAREAKFLETAQGRIALISCSSTFPDHSRAGNTRGDIPPRPGLNPLRYRTHYHLSDPRMDELTEIAKDLGMVDDTLQNTKRLRLWGETFLRKEESGKHTEPHAEDLEAIASVVRNARRLSDLCIVTIHAHERDSVLASPAEFLVTFARAMIDAGADIVVGHGPHVLRALEIYKDKPIFYSLGDFMFQNETLLRLPYENYERYDLTEDEHVADFNARRYKNDSVGFPARPQVWESVIAVPVWQNRQLQSITLYPITLGYGQPPSVRGRPMLAKGELGQKIIGDIQELSDYFKTRIEWKDGVGVVQLE